MLIIFLDTLRPLWYINPILLPHAQPPAWGQMRAAPFYTEATRIVETTVNPMRTAILVAHEMGQTAALSTLGIFCSILRQASSELYHKHRRNYYHSKTMQAQSLTVRKALVKRRL